MPAALPRIVARAYPTILGAVLAPSVRSGYPELEQLGHRNSTVTRTVYIQEIKSAERTSRRRARMDAEYSALLEAAAASASL
jgi:hypothetical protein